MTMIGAMHCSDGVVLLADGQETIADYAKWDVEKMKTAHLNGCVRIVMTGAGDADNIEMIWEKISALWEDHFRVLKREMAILPLLSCATGVIRQTYGLKDRMERLELVVKALTTDQEKMRRGKRKPGRIDDSVGPRIKRLVNHQIEREKARHPQSDSQT